MVSCPFAQIPCHFDRSGAMLQAADTFLIPRTYSLVHRSYFCRIFWLTQNGAALARDVFEETAQEAASFSSLSFPSVWA